MKFKYKMFQTEWQGISLIEIAEQKQLDMHQVASSDFYDEFYRKLEENDWRFEPDWLETKRKNGRWLGSVIETLKTPQAKILSVGAGLGVVEEELIRRGHDIELQECQEKSFGYLKNRGFDSLKLWISPDLKDLPSQCYDVIYSNLMVYALKDSEYENFLWECNRILKDGGTLIITDIVANVKWFLLQPVILLKHMIDRKPRVFWGYVRSVDMHKKIAKKKGFKPQKVTGFDDDGDISETNAETNGYIYKKEVSLWKV